MKSSIRWTLVAVGGIAVATTIFMTWDSAIPEIHLAQEPPPGFEFVFSKPVVNDGLVTQVEGARYKMQSKPDQTVAVRVRTYPGVALEQLMSPMDIPPNPNFANDDLDVGSLDGIGLGDDVIWCGNGRPDSCRAWAYWSHYGHQFLAVILYVEPPGETMSPEDFRNVVRGLLT